MAAAFRACRVWITVGALALVQTGGVVDAAAPQNKTRALRLYRQAQKLFEQGDYRAAARDHEGSYALNPHPNNLYFIGEAYRRLGELRKSHAYYLPITPETVSECWVLRA